ncbi:hypothetical protein [Acidianus bottle-shaped virus]|uniref:Uncharacterized protein ORF83 n=1 Tax=Acidianus bottle-shaped virus (isolate Italy/Pozzuoli) TaxID=654911 RepID=Y083_ABVP|nr:hypothetical protein ABV_gp52 [Acidianus bottle-shaped virus]A4ZUD8.1 RecName: Full=Uncharacterized protein ORF83 [Acidianus bottle-shaped virus (isolate Pozzuoli)]ABP73442.1 hypothetical protein [Acidianus bottle-shaped virus]
MNDTFYYELKENVSNLKSLSKKLYDYVDTLLTPNLSVDKGILINMLRTFANQVDITYYYFELVETKIDSDDPLSPVISTLREC